jgi:hypothetical protein
MVEHHVSDHRDLAWPQFPDQNFEPLLDRAHERIEPPHFFVEPTPRLAKSFPLAILMSQEERAATCCREYGSGLL